MLVKPEAGTCNRKGGYEGRLLSEQVSLYPDLLAGYRLAPVLLDPIVADAPTSHAGPTASSSGSVARRLGFEDPVLHGKAQAWKVRRHVTAASQEQLVADALKGYLEESREFLIIESGPYYVQFPAAYTDGMEGRKEAGRSVWEVYAESGLYAEAVSDEYLEPSERLGADGAARLKRLGWSPPSNEPNWSRVFELRGPMDCAVIARSVITTFVDGFGTTAPFRFDVGSPIC